MMSHRLSSTYSLPTMVNLIDHAGNVLHKAQAKELAPFGISPQELSVMEVISKIRDAPTPAKISRHLFTEAHSTSELLERMARKELVKKTKDLERKNWVRVSLTPKGYGIYQQAATIQSCRKVLSCLSREERYHLGSILSKLISNGAAELNLNVEQPVSRKKQIRTK